MNGNNSTFYLTEVLSDEKNAMTSIDKLQRAEHFARSLIKSTFPNDSEFQIYKVLTSFVPLNPKLTEQATKKEIMILEMNRTINDKVLSKILKGDSQKQEFFSTIFSQQ